MKIIFNKLLFNIINLQNRQRFESGKYTGLILIDLQKAFDTIDHEMLLKKMGCIGFSEKVISWFESYLLRRTFKEAP